MLWETTRIMELLRPIAGVKIEKNAQGGDYDTEYIIVKRGSDAYIEVFGMSPGVAVQNPANTKITHLFTCKNDRYGMEDAEPDDFELLAEVQKALQAGGYKQFHTDGWKAHF